MSKRDSLLAIDYVKNVAGGTSRVVSGGGGTVDTSGFLLLDGSRVMTGNLDMGGFNINNVNLLDGVDLPAHVANANAHHNRQHTYDSTLDHTGTLSWVNVNKAGSNLTDIVTRAHSSLQGIGPNDHHNRSHSITSASDHTVTGSAFDLVGLSAPNTLAILTPSANVQSGIERILKSTSAGNLGLASLTTPLINASANLTIQPTGDIVLDPQGNDVLPSLNYDINLGAISKKYLTLHAAELWVETLVAQNTIATIGGRILVGPTTYLTRDIGTGDTTIYVRHNQMISGDRVYMEASGFVEFFAITSGATTISATEFSYTVTRNLDGSGANTWYAGDAMFNTGQTGNGFIDLYSIRGVKTASQYGPTIVGNIRNSSTYNDWTESWAIGNLNGLYGYGTNLYGAGFGKYESGKPNIVIDPTNGVRLRQYTTDMIVLDASGNSYFAGVMTIGISGEIRQGTGTLGSNYTGLRIWRDTDIGRIAGYNNNTVQWYGGTDGYLYAGAGSAAMMNYGFLFSDSDISGGGTWPFTYGGIHAVDSVSSPSTGYRGSLMYGVPVGVFAATPTAWHFHYPGTLPANTPSPSGGASWSTALAISDNTQSHFVWHTGNDGSGSGLDADTLDTKHASDFVQYYSGNVGIGTTSPSYPLHVNGSMVIDGNNVLYMKKNTSSTLAAVLAVSGTLPDATVLQSVGGGVTLRTSAGASVLTATEGGNVGIGTTSPGSALDVRTGIIRVGNTSDLFSAKIQTSGNIHAQGAITSETYLQNVAASAPAGVLGYARLYLESLGSNRYRLRCVMRNEYNTADVNTVLAQNY